MEELNSKQIEQLDEIENAVYEMLCRIQGYDVNDEDIDEKFPWDISVIREVLDVAVETLNEHDYPVCDPYMENDVNCIDLDCPSCNCKSCICKE